MAGDWIKMRIDLASEPEVIGISELTGLDEDAVVGKLLRLWGWADQKTTDGNAACVTQMWIDRYVSHDGFATAMLKVGWLNIEQPSDKNKIGGVSFPNFDRHNTETGKRRALGARRAAKRRTNPSRNSNAKSNASSVTKSAPTEEKRREDNIGDASASPREGGKNRFDPIGVDLPPELDNDRFRQSWASWVDYRKNTRRKPLSLAACSQQIPKLAQFGADVAIEAIEASIANDWTGLFPERVEVSKSSSGLDNEARRRFLERHAND